MKRILQALDGVGTKPVEGASDMAKFLSVVDNALKPTLTEGANPHKVALPVQMAMQHYQQPTKKFVAEKTNIRTGLNKFFKDVETEIQEEQNHKKQIMRQYASLIAERVLMKESKEDISEDHASPVPGEHHSLGFNQGRGAGSPGIMQDPMAETPLDFNPASPMDSEIHSHQGVNPASIKSRMMRAARQLADLAEKAESNNPIVWQHIASLFPELAMNIEQVRHGVEELAKIKKGGGVRSKNIPSGLGEGKSNKQEIPQSKPRNFVAKNAMATTSGAGAHKDKKKAMKQGEEKHKGKSYSDMMEDIDSMFEEFAAPKKIKPKKKTTSCRTGQVQTGMQNKDGKMVPKCSVKQTAK